MTTTEATGTDVLASALDRWFADHGSDLVALRRDLHAHPELSHDEHRTTGIVSGIMSANGYDLRPMSCGTGVFAERPRLDDGSDHDGSDHDRSDDGSGDEESDHGGSHPLVAVRADLDALAMHDLKDVPYRSVVDGVSHACGHDVHTTVAVGAARFLADHPHLATHRVRFLFQPAEERVPGGALDVLRDGGLDGVSTVLGLHCEPKLDVGRIGLRPGAITSAADMATITVRGPGGHTARPELTVDTVEVASRIVTEAPDRVRSSTPDGAVKMVFGAVHGGDAANVIPTSVQLRCSIRTPSLDTWETMEAAVRTAVSDVAAGTGAEIDVDYVRGVPPTVNDPAVVGALRTAATTVVGVDGIHDAEQSWGGDDFAWLTREVAGAYVRLGVRTPGGATLDLHAGHFDVDERAIEVGVRFLVTALCAPLGAPAARSTDPTSRHVDR